MSYTVLRSDSATILGLRPASAVQRRGALVASGRHWNRWYSTDRRARIRKQLLAHTLCCFCLQRGIVTPAAICDHVEPHHGDVNKFWLAPFQSLRNWCHDSAKKFVVYRPDIGLDGCVARSSCRPSLDRVAWGQVRRGSKWPFSPGSRSIGPRALSDPG
jgi:5-methylcytosine-specific restriction enzyme A